MKALNRLPQNENSPKKFLLKLTIWVLVSSILFAFAFQFRNFLTFTSSVIIYSAVISGSAFLFYVYFIYEAKKNSGNCEKNASSPSFCTEDDHNRQLATSILEKV